jgi:uncharacterized iron-regulated protein
MSPEELVTALATKRFMLLGELHDNPDHHRLQAWLVAQVKPTAVVLEMADVDQAAALEAFQSKPDWQPAALGATLDWERRGWPKWSTYQPIAEAAKETGATILAGNAEREKVRTVAKGGHDVLDGAETKRLGLDEPLPSDAEAALQAEIAASHCGMLPEKVVPAMASAQRLRDATLADQLLTAAGRDARVVLITGNGHVRRDRGVPYVLERRGLAATEIASVMLLEVDPETGAALDLVPRDGAGKPVADYIWITPAASRPDPCEEMKRQMKGTTP